MNLSDLHAKLSANAAYAREYDAIGDRVMLGAQIRAARLAEDLTQERLASVLNLRIGIVRKVEAGSLDVAGATLGAFAERLYPRLLAQGVNRARLDELVQFGRSAEALDPRSVSVTTSRHREQSSEQRRGKQSQVGK
jgi:transcriptional regulator with XRE-family HTH domain